MSLINVASELILAASAGISPFYLLWRKLHSKNRLVVVHPDDGADALRLQQIHGYNAHSLVSISGEKKFWFNSAKEGAISYNEKGNVWIVGGEPIASEKGLLPTTQEFLAYARTKKKKVAFLPVTERFARLIDSTKFDVIKIGAAPYFDLQNWNPRGNKAKHLRVALNNSKRAGLSVAEITQVTGEFRSEVAELSAQWLKSRRAKVTFGWLFALNVFEKAENKKFFAARDESGKLVGVLAASPIPLREGWYLEDVLRAEDAQKGTSELLVYETLKILASQGAKLATLGTVPLSEKGADDLMTNHNRLTKMSLKLSRRKLGGIYNFEGLQRFKSKFVPTWWESEYAVSGRGRFSALRIVHALFYIIVPGGIAKTIQAFLDS